MGSDAKFYVFTDTNAPQDEYESVLVERATGEHDEKWIHKGGAPVELTDEQYQRLVGHIQLQQVDPADYDLEQAVVVEQPGVNQPGTSTDLPPRGVPQKSKDELDAMSQLQLLDAAAQAGVQGASKSMSKGEIVDLILAKYADDNQEG